jgi:hypothetical protein
MINEQNNIKYNSYICFDPTGLKGFGREFIEGPNYFGRYVSYSKLFFKGRYFPYGPSFKSAYEFKQFLIRLDKDKFTKTKLDLPLILDDKGRKQVLDLLKEFGYKKDKYIQDKETILLTKNDYKLDPNYVRYVKRAEEKYVNEIIFDPTEEQIKEVYEIYSSSGKGRGFNISKLEGFLELPGKVLSLMKDDKGEIQAFVLGSRVTILVNLLDIRYMFLMFSALTEIGRKDSLGYIVRTKLFDHLFSNNLIDIIDFHGADRERRTYVEFKKSFGGNFYPLTGSFSKIKVF